MACDGTNESNIDLEKDLNDSNSRIMALDTNILDKVGGTIEFGKRSDLFWIAMTFITLTVLIVSTVFKKKK